MQRKHFLLTALAATPLSLFARIAPKPANEPFKVDRGKSRFQESLTYHGVNKQDIKVSKKDTGGALSMLEYIGKEKVGPRLHVHFDQDEVFFVKTGEYRFVAGNQTFLAGEGDTVFLPRNVPHTWIQLSEIGSMLYLLQPSGSFEEFLREMQSLKKPPTDEELQEIHLRHGMKVLGPPLTY